MITEQNKLMKSKYIYSLLTYHMLLGKSQLKDAQQPTHSFVVMSYSREIHCDPLCLE